MKKKSISRDSISKISNDFLSDMDKERSVTHKGIFGDKTREPVPQFISAPCEKVISGENNTWIVFGKDRPSDRQSGYGSRGDTRCGTIDIVVGRLGYRVVEVNENQEPMYVDNNFELDSSRVYISSKTDVDDNFKIVNGTVGNSRSKSSIALKSDAIRILAREGIKIVTGINKKNSHGGELQTIFGIDLIAGNNDEFLQPIPKGGNLRESMERMVHHIDKLNGIVDTLLMTQMEFNEALTHHFHYSPFFGAPTTPAIDVVVPKGIKCQMDMLTKVKTSLVAHKKNLAAFKLNYFSPLGENYINSRYNNVN